MPAAPPTVVPESERLVGYAPQTHLADGWDPRALGTLAPPATPAPRERLAVPAFVLAWVLAPVGAVLGVVAAVRARRTRRRGVGLAVAAVVVGLTVSVVVPTVVLPSSGAWARAVGATAPLGDVTVPTGAYARQLRDGHCLGSLPDGNVRRVTVVPCDGPHAATVVAVVPLRGSTWPGDDAALHAVATRCRIMTTRGAEAVVLTPTSAGWRAGDRTGLCVTTPRPGA